MNHLTINPVGVGSLTAVVGAQIGMNPVQDVVTNPAQDILPDDTLVKDVQGDSQTSFELNVAQQALKLIQNDSASLVSQKTHAIKLFEPLLAANDILASEKLVVGSDRVLTGSTPYTVVASHDDRNTSEAQAHPSDLALSQSSSSIHTTLSATTAPATLKRSPETSPRGMDALSYFMRRNWSSIQDLNKLSPNAFEDLLRMTPEELVTLKQSMVQRMEVFPIGRQGEDGTVYMLHQDYLFERLSIHLINGILDNTNSWVEQYQIYCVNCDRTELKAYGENYGISNLEDSVRDGLHPVAMLALSEIRPAIEKIAKVYRADMDDVIALSNELYQDRDWKKGHIPTRAPLAAMKVWMLLAGLQSDQKKEQSELEFLSEVRQKRDVLLTMIKHHTTDSHLELFRKQLLAQI